MNKIIENLKEQVSALCQSDWAKFAALEIELSTLESSRGVAAEDEKILISRVGNILQDFYRRSDYELEEAIGDILNIFNSQLCQPRGEWISVKDRLPENSCSVLVATDQGGVGEMWFDNLLNWHVLKENAKVLFWMPLPASPLKKISNVKL